MRLSRKSCIAFNLAWKLIKFRLTVGIASVCACKNVYFHAISKIIDWCGDISIQRRNLVPFKIFGKDGFLQQSENRKIFCQKTPKLRKHDKSGANMVRPYLFSHNINLSTKSAGKAHLIRKTTAWSWEFNRVRGYSATTARQQTHMPPQINPNDNPDKGKTCFRHRDTETQRHRDTEAQRHRGIDQRNIPSSPALH